MDPSPHRIAHELLRQLAADEEFDAESLLDAMKDFEYKWWKERPGTFSSTPNGDPKAAVRKVLDSI